MRFPGTDGFAKNNLARFEKFLFVLLIRIVTYVLPKDIDSWAKDGQILGFRSEN